MKTQPPKLNFFKCPEYRSACLHHQPLWELLKRKAMRRRTNRAACHGWTTGPETATLNRCRSYTAMVLNKSLLVLRGINRGKAHLSVLEQRVDVTNSQRSRMFPRRPMRA